MPKYVAIGYGDRAGYDRTDSDVRNAAHEHDAVLRAGGAVMGVAGKPVQVRNAEDAGTSVEDGPFMTASLPVAGITLLEAESLEAAVAMVSKTPCAVAHGVVEVWPLD